MEIRLSELVGKGFWGSHRAIRDGCNELLEAGGRGSGKSSYLSIELILQLLKHPHCHAVVLRKVASTLRTSVYAQLLWAMDALHLTDYFRCSLSPLEMEYLPTGQKILFFGMDDAGKLKSLKMPRGYIGLAWFEELDQFDAEEVRSAEQSLFRGGEFSLCLKSFNPPAGEKHWANQYFLEEKVGKFAHKSTYLELPEAWLGERFLGDAEHLKKVNPPLYGLEYLGIPLGSGEEVFPNLVLGNGSFDKLRMTEEGRTSTCHSERSRGIRALGGCGHPPLQGGTDPSTRLRLAQDDRGLAQDCPHPSALRAATFPQGKALGGRSMTAPTLPCASGVDWGWWPDPWAFNRVAYDGENRVLYVLKELHCYRTGNRETGLMVKNTIPAGETVTADSAEPKSIGDYRQLGLCCRGAKKGPGSVAYGLKWLQSLAAIVIDPEACPETAREFAACRYVNGAIPDRDNHHIDAVRYASQVFWRN